MNVCTHVDFRINANVVKDGSFRINAKSVREKIKVQNTPRESKYARDETREIRLTVYR